MRVLVTGATGFIGRALGQRLTEEGHRLVVLSRTLDGVKSRLGFDCELHAWDPMREEAPAEAFSGGVDAVIHLAGEPIGDRRWSPALKQRIRDSRIVGTRHLVETINRCFESGEGRPGLFIGASAIGFYGDRADEILTEDSHHGTGYLAEVCEDWEREIKCLSGPRRAILRFGVVLGREGGALKKMLPLFRRGLGGPLGDGHQWMSWIHIDDLVSLILHILKTSTVEGVLNAVAPLPISNAEFTRALGHVVGKRTWLRVPRGALELGLGEMAQVVLASQRVLPVRARACGFHFRYERIEDALRDCVQR